ncbi:histidine kinase [Nonomuraea sp. NPDC046570]|uniref:sensor histidine kinase n=1 Tax=Nonomuraea sp. NPDC046570 TaxID=3155255 RepID=UPI0033F9F2EA
MARRRYIDELEQHAERLRRDEQAAVQRAVLRERTALARDLHDVISHHVSTIGMHAGAARMSLADPAPAVHRSLSAVESSSRAAMVDLRRLLDVLHGGGPGAAHRQPGLDNIDDLLDGVRAAGLPVRLAAQGRRRELSGSVDMAVYRAVQEALTNAVRHGDGAGADVELRYRDDGVGVVVTNGMDAAPLRFGARGAGRGLAGLRQRVALFGGTVRYGPERGGRTWRFEADFTDRGGAAVTPRPRDEL